MSGEPVARIEINHEFGEWIGQAAPWDYFATLTFAGPPGQLKNEIWGQRLSRGKGVQGRWHGVTPSGALYFTRRYLTQMEAWENGTLMERSSRENGYGYVDDPQLPLSNSRIHAFLAVEEGKTGGLVHVHALLGNVRNVAAFCGERLPAGKWGLRCCATHGWPCGYARVLPYDAAQGANFYVAKYVSKQLAEWELWGFPIKK
jgi:hypothetical protein